MGDQITIPHDIHSNLASSIESCLAIGSNEEKQVVHVVNESKGFNLYPGKELRIEDLIKEHGPFKSFSGYCLPEDLHEIIGYGVPFFAVERRIEEGEWGIYILTRERREKDILERVAEYQELLSET
jgi:hypothetical protein